MLNKRLEMDQLRQKVANLESLLKEEIETKATAFRPLHKEQQNLQKLNQSLEKRVAEEVQKNRDKDRIMYQQSRLAQMGEMISMIAHQWRQPLSSINAIGVNLKLKALLSEENSQYVEEVIPQLEKIESIVQYMSSTIDDFRNFYRPNKEQVQITLNTPLKKAVQLMKATLNSHDITVHEIYHSVHQHAVFDGELLQVVINILKNAQDNFVEKQVQEGLITLQTYDVGEKSIMKICDNGGGIDITVLDNIFDPYFSTKSEKNGTGLGLYMSKAIVETHHAGKLYAQNEGDGVCFYIEL